MARLPERFGRFLNLLESRWSLWTLVQGSGLMASFGLPAWAVRSAQIFSEYSPFSWVVAGFLGVFVASLIRLIFIFSSKIAVKVRYDARLLEKGSVINPLDLTFE